MQTQIPFGDDRQKSKGKSKCKCKGKGKGEGNGKGNGKGKNSQQHVPIQGSFASAVKARPQAQDDREKRTTATTWVPAGLVQVFGIFREMKDTLSVGIRPTAICLEMTAMASRMFVRDFVLFALAAAFGWWAHSTYRVVRVEAARIYNSGLVVQFDGGKNVHGSLTIAGRDSVLSACLRHRSTKCTA